MQENWWHLFGPPLLPIRYPRTFGLNRPRSTQIPSAFPRGLSPIRQTGFPSWLQLLRRHNSHCLGSHECVICVRWLLMAWCYLCAYTKKSLRGTQRGWTMCKRSKYMSYSHNQSPHSCLYSKSVPHSKGFCQVRPLWWWVLVVAWLLWWA
jgi:hypothetical protein